MSDERQEQCEIILEEPCPACAGTGKIGHPGTGYLPPCYDCEGTGRRLTPLGRQVFAVVTKRLAWIAPTLKDLID